MIYLFPGTENRESNALTLDSYILTPTSKSRPRLDDRYAWLLLWFTCRSWLAWCSAWHAASVGVHGESLCPENWSSAVGALSGAFPGSSRLRTGVVLFVTGQILIFHVICVEAICRALGVLPVMAIENEGRSAGRLRAGDVHPRACAAHQLSEYKLVEVHRFYSSNPLRISTLYLRAQLPTCHAKHRVYRGRMLPWVHIRHSTPELSTCIQDHTHSPGTLCTPVLSPQNRQVNYRTTNRRTYHC